MHSKLGRKVWIIAAAAVVMFAGLAWWQRTPVLAWYYLRGLAEADADGRAVWVDRAASLDVAAVPGLLDLLQSKDPTVCDNAEQTLTTLVKRWGAEDTRSAGLADECRSRFAGLSALGQISALQVVATLLRQEGPKTLPVVITRNA